MRSSQILIPAPAAADAAFLATAVQTAVLAAEISELTLQRGMRGPVQAFAGRLIDEMARLEAGLRTLARKLAVDLPEGLDAGRQQLVNDLDRAPVAALAERYLTLVVDCCQELVTVFANASATCEDTDIVIFASRRLPQLRARREAAVLLKAG